jgi:flagellar protein FliO/FliZ
MITRLITKAAFVAVACSGMHSAIAADAPLFAAPSAGQTSAPTSAGSIGQVTLALTVVLALVFVAGWALRYLRKLNIAGGDQQLEIVAQVSLGAKERAVLIRLNDVQVLVGVAPGQVTALHTGPAPIGKTGVVPSDGSATQEAVAKPSFQSLLKKSLGM